MAESPIKALVLLLEEEDEEWKQWESLSEDERVEKLKEVHLGLLRLLRCCVVAL